MTRRVWPTREEWEADAERATRHERFAHERLPAGAVFATPEETAESERLLAGLDLLAPDVRRALTARITELRGRFPDRPAGGRDRIAWFVDLEGDAYTDAGTLAELERARRDLAAGRLSVVNVLLAHPTLVDEARWMPARQRLAELHDQGQARRDRAAAQAEQAAVDAEIERRRTDKAWRQQLERRASIDGPTVLAPRRPTHHQEELVITTDTDRCAAAHLEDRTSCEGPRDAVTVLDPAGTAVAGCEHHGARLLASLEGGRVEPGSVDGAAIRVFKAADALPPFCWYTNTPRTQADQRSHAANRALANRH